MMNLIAPVVTEFFMVMLCILSAPSDKQEIRIDRVNNSGYADTVIVRRQDAGFIIYNETNGMPVQFATIVPKAGAENVYICTDKKGRSETVELSRAIKGFKPGDLRSRPRLYLVTKNGGKISIIHSKDLVFLTTAGTNFTYIVH